MKKKILGSLVALSIATVGIYADDTVYEGNLTSNHYGIGASVGNLSTIIQVPINMENDMRLEPYIGFIFTDYDNNSNAVVQAGAALHKMYTIQDSLRGYYGGFLGIESYSGDTTSTNVAFGPILGAEYYFNNKFCLGAEIKLNAVVGDTTRVSTASSVLVRYYF